jgi:hypothetical protein
MASHKLRILSMKWNNVRNFEQLPNPILGVEKFEFDQDGWTLKQIQNNYGKTSTMHLLRSCFTGVKMPKDKLKGYRYRQGRTDWGGDPEAKVEFSVMFSLDEDIFQIRTVLDWKNKTQEFHTYRKGTGGERAGWNPPPYFASLFEKKSDFAELLVLDGEKARKMNRATGGNTIGKAVRQVTGLSSVCDLIDEGGTEGRISGLVKLLNKQGGERKEDDLETALKLCSDHKENLETERDKLGDKLEGLMKDLNDTKEKLIAFDDKYKSGDEDFEKAVTAKERAKSALDRDARNVMKQLFNPGDSLGDNLWEDVKDFYGTQIRGKLPGEATGLFFEEIVEDRDECICGTEWTEKMKEIVLKERGKYIDHRIHPRVKRMQKKVVESDSTTDIGTLKAGLDAKRKAYLQASKRERELRKDFPEEERKKYKTLSIKEGKLETLLDQEKFKFDIYNSENRDFILEHDLDYHVRTKVEKHNYITVQPYIFIEINNISQIRVVEENLLLLILDTGESAEKARGAKILKDVLQESIGRVLQEIQKELEVKMNDFASKMPGVEFDITISESKLIFTNATGDVQDDANESAELGAVYGLVAALNEYADISLPIIVDTPLAGFGKGMAKSWKDVIGDGFEQGIALLNSSEKDDLRFWWSQEDLVVYTFLRENEVIRTGKDPNGGPTTGTMYIDDTLETFDLYEIDVGYSNRDTEGGE